MKKKYKIYEINEKAIYKTYQYTLHVLKVNKEAREDDSVLYFAVCDEIAPNGIGGLLFEDVLMNRKEYRLPSYATVVRCRRKIFEEHPELRPSPKKEKMRLEQTIIIKKFVQKE